MNGYRENVKTPDSRLVGHQLGDDKSVINPSWENNDAEHGVENRMFGPAIMNNLSINTVENEERFATEPKVKADPNFVTSSEPLENPVLSSASSTSSIILAGHLEDLSLTVDKILESGGGVKECFRSTDLSYLGVTAEQSEMLLQHGEFPATPKIAPIPCSWNTPHFDAKEKGQSIYLDFRSTYPFTGHSMKTTADLSSSLSNHSSTKSLPSIVSFDSGEGESAWSSVSPRASAWMSAASNCESDKTKAQQYVTPPTYCNGPLQQQNWNSDLNEKFYMFKDFKSSSYQERHDKSNVPPGSKNKTQLNSAIDMNIKRENLLPQKNALYSYSGHQSYTGSDGENNRNIWAENSIMKTMNTLQKGSRDQQPHVPMTTSGNYSRMAEAMSSTKAYLGMPDSSTPLSQAIKSPNSSEPFNISEYRTFPLMDVSRILPGRNLLHDVVPEESPMAIQTHPLFPLLRFLASAEIYHENASRFITAVFELLPSSTSELISMFLRGNRDNKYINCPSTNIATESAIRDAITCAHRCLREKIASSEGMKTLASVEEATMEIEVNKVCLKYLDEVRSSTHPPPQQCLNVDSTSVLNGNPLSSLNQLLEAFSPIPLSLDAAGISQTSDATPSKYTRAMEVVKKWLKEHEDHPYPDDDQKSMLMSQTGLSSKEVTEMFSFRTDP